MSRLEAFSKFQIYFDQKQVQNFSRGIYQCSSIMFTLSEGTGKSLTCIIAKLNEVISYFLKIL